MLTIQQETDGPACVWRMNGRLDGAGAPVFDRQTRELSSAIRHVVLDFKNVEYLSSAGIRSLLLLERLLIARGSGVTLCEVPSFVAQVLDQAGLTGRFRLAACVDDSMRMIRELEGTGKIESVTVRDRAYRIQRTGKPQPPARVWGSLATLFSGKADAVSWTTAHLDELGLSFGFGGLGHAREQAVAGHGLFISTGHLIALQPADGAGIPDYLATAKPEETVVHVSSAISLEGTPLLHAQGPTGAITLRDWVADAAHLAEPAPMWAFCLAGQSPHVVGRFFRTADHLHAGQTEAVDTPDASGLLYLGIVSRKKPSWPQAVSHDLDGLWLMGIGCWFPQIPFTHEDLSLERLLQTVTKAETIAGVADLNPNTTLDEMQAWIFQPSEWEPATARRMQMVVHGEETFPAEWDAIARRIYKDVSRLELTRLAGGFSATTFQATSYDRDGRRLLPTILKISTLDFTRREESAYRQYVEKFILNNSTVIMGHATRGQWSGLRYNFLGITGPESKLTWLHDHYQTRPIEEVDPIIERLYARILYPWYGQAKEQPVALFDDNNPLRLFPRLLEDAEKLTGIRPDQQTVRCEPLDMELPNPWWVLNTLFRERVAWTMPWFSSITHGDLNMRNVLLDEKENLYVIDFSETRLRNVFSDFARLEQVLKFDMISPADEEEYRRMLVFEQAMLKAESASEAPPFVYDGKDPMVPKAHHTISRLRRLACGYTQGRGDLLPYLVALLEWTLPVPFFIQLTDLQKRYAFYSAALLSRRVMELLAV